MKWFPLHRAVLKIEAPKISLDKKYLTTAYPNDLNYIPLDLLGDLKKLTCPNKVWLLTDLCLLLKAASELVTGGVGDGVSRIEGRGEGALGSDRRTRSILSLTCCDWWASATSVCIVNGQWHFRFPNNLKRRILILLLYWNTFGALPPSLLYLNMYLAIKIIHLILLLSWKN